MGTPTMTRVAEEAPSLDELRELLVPAGLPIDDLADDPRLRLFGVRGEEGWVGAVGVWPLERSALLRSLVVRPAARGRGIGAALVAAAEAHARSGGRPEVYLLTTGAKDYFARLGYGVVARDAVPASVRGTRQFSQLCPSTATVMRKVLD
jgi:N-acetylglutamate synthase-like GNAT family acetyltransferase